jgi:hypothetical protein
MLSELQDQLREVCNVESIYGNNLKNAVLSSFYAEEGT